MTLIWRNPPFTGAIGRVASAAATVRTWPGSVRRKKAGAVKSIEIGPVLLHVVHGDEQPWRQLALDAERPDLAARVLEGRGRVVHELSNVEELRIEIRPARPNRDVTCRQRAPRRVRVEGDRRAGQAGGETGLAGRRLIREDALRPADLEVGVQAGTQLRVVETVAAANRGLRVAERIPAESAPRREVAAVRERLAVVPDSGVHRHVAARTVGVLREQGEQPLPLLVCSSAEVEALLVTLHVGERQTFRGRRSRRV